jgi:hypothetical protein
MGVKKLAAKVAEYYERLEQGKASKIKPNHVEQVLKKLRAKEAELQAEIETVDSDDKKARLERKLGIAQEHIARAEYLLTELSSSPD